jgi:tetratricopeptide (TPR) repeat protein
LIIPSTLFVIFLLTGIFVFSSDRSFGETPKTFYTIQTESFTDVTNAHEQFNSIKRIFTGKDLDYLRIEKVGKFYSVRLGKFEDDTSAEKFLRLIKSRLPEAIILNAYIINERITRSYIKNLSDKKGIDFVSPEMAVNAERRPAYTGKKKSVHTLRDDNKNSNQVSAFSRESEKPLTSIPQNENIHSSQRDAYLYSALKHEIKRDYSRALADYKKALEIDKNNFKIMNNIAYIYFQPLNAQYTA